MKELSTEQIQKNWEQLRNLITNTFEGERLEKLNKMYDHFEDRMCIAPASGKEQYHYAHVGGYVEHVLHVVDCALKITNLWASDCLLYTSPSPRDTIRSRMPSSA